MLSGYLARRHEGLVNVWYRFNEKRELSNGKESFEIVDEHYFVESNEGILVFLNSVSEHGESVASGTKGYGEGRVCGYAPAYDEEGLMDAAVQMELKDTLNGL